MTQQQSISLARALLYEVPRTLLWVFPIAFAVAYAYGTVGAIPAIFGHPVEIDLSKFGI